LLEQAKTIRKAINVLLGKSEVTVSPGMQEITTPLGIADSIRKAFDDYPERNWTPPTLRDELQKLRDKKLLKSDARDLLTSINSPLQRLVRNGYVRKSGKGLHTRYKLSYIK